MKYHQTNITPKIKCLIINFISMYNNDMRTNIDENKNHIKVPIKIRIGDIYQLYFRYYKIHCWFTKVASVAELFFFLLCLLLFGMN